LSKLKVIGVIKALGSDVNNFTIGDRVYFSGTLLNNDTLKIRYLALHENLVHAVSNP